MKSSHLALLCTSLAAALVVGISPQVVALREVQLYLTDVFGRSKYRLILDMPAEVVVGQELEMSFTLYLDELPPLKHYSSYVSLTFTLVSEDGRTMARRSVNNHMDAYKVDYIYPGYRWGPYMLTVVPDYSMTRRGGKIMLYVSLESEEYVEDPLGIPVIATRPNPYTVSAGEITLVQTFPPFESIAAGLITAAALGTILAYWRMRSRWKTS